MSTKFPSIVQALMTVCWGDIGWRQAISSIYSGLLPEEFKRLRIVHKTGLFRSDNSYVWIGQIPKIPGEPEPIGRWWIPQLLDGRAVQKAVNTHGKDSVSMWHSGLGEHSVSALVSCPVESDDISLDQQATQLDRLQTAVGMPLSLVVMSGDVRDESVRRAGVAPDNVVPGKSLHAYFALSPTLNSKLPEHKAIWKQILDHLIVFLRSDPVINDVPRLMRCPSVLGYRAFREGRGHTRIQTTLYAEYHGVNPWELLDRLKEALHRDGVQDVKAALDAIKVARNWVADAKVGREEGLITEQAKDEVAALAAATWQQRSVDPQIAAKIAELLPKRKIAGRSRPGYFDQRPTDIVADGIDPECRDMLYLEPEYSLLLQGGFQRRLDAIQDKVRCNCPGHGYRSRSRTSAFAWRRDETVFVCCTSCRMLWKLEPAGLPRACTGSQTPWTMENGNE